MVVGFIRHLSEGARDLVSRFLEKDPRKRITIKEVRLRQRMSAPVTAECKGDDEVAVMD